MNKMQAFQHGLDSYYEDWNNSKVSMFKGLLQHYQENGQEFIEEFEEGRACAEDQDTLYTGVFDN